MTDHPRRVIRIARVVRLGGYYMAVWVSLTPNGDRCELRVIPQSLS